MHRFSNNKKGKPHNSPIVIAGKNKMSYFIVRDYMSSKLNEVWVNQDSAEEYICKSGLDGKMNECNVVDGQVLVHMRQS